MKKDRDSYHFDDFDIAIITTKLGLMDFISDVYLALDDKSYSNLWFNFSKLANNGLIHISPQLIDEIISDKRVKLTSTKLERFNHFCDIIISKMCNHIDEEEIVS